MSSGTTSYTESNTLTIAVADNGKKVCFSSTDTAGNSSHTANSSTGDRCRSTDGDRWLSAVRIPQNQKMSTISCSNKWCNGQV